MKRLPIQELTLNTPGSTVISTYVSYATSTFVSYATLTTTQPTTVRLLSLPCKTTSSPQVFEVDGQSKISNKA